jgi:hypothetical protein
MKTKIIAIFFAISTLCGCSSIVSKSEYPVAINSSPDQATFIIKNRAGQEIHSGITPQTVTLKSSAGFFKGESYSIALNKEGYSEKQFTLTSTVDGWYFGNILFGGLVGMLIVDPATGAMYKLPPSVDVNFDEAPLAANTDELIIGTLDSLTEEQKARLVAIN